MTAPGKQESKDRTQQQHDADELQDRIINLRDQERQVQREAAERREQEALEAIRRERQVADRQRRQQVEAYSVIGRQAQDAARQIEDGTRHVARGAALTVSALIPPMLGQPSLLVDAVFNGVIAVLGFERDFLNGLLSTATLVDAR